MAQMIVAIVGAIAGIIAIVAVIWRGGQLTQKINSLWEADLPGQIRDLDRRVTEEVGKLDQRVTEEVRGVIEEIRGLDRRLTRVETILETKLDVLWRAYVQEPLSGISRRGKANRSSTWRLTEEGRNTIEESIKKRIDQIILDKTFSEPYEIAPFIAYELGVEFLSEKGEEVDLTLSQYLALLSVYAVEQVAER